MSELAKFEYSMGDSEQRFSLPEGLNIYGGSWWMIADELAEDYFNNHDGWESSWPLTLRIYSGREEVAAFTIEMEREPVFRAYELDEEKGSA